MAYLDPASNTTKTCTTNCVLSNDASVEYQDFRILNTTMTSGIAIDVKSWYGSSGGLASVSVFQSGKKKKKETSIDLLYFFLHLNFRKFHLCY